MATAVKVPALSKGGRVGRKRTEVDTSTYSGKLAARLRQLREAKGLTVDELAGKAGIEAKRLYHYEAGARSIDSDLYPALAKALGCKSPADFFPPLK